MAHTKEQPGRHPVRVYLYRADAILEDRTAFSGENASNDGMARRKGSKQMAYTKEQPGRRPVRVYLYRASEKDQRIVIVSNGRSTAAQVSPLHSIDAVAEKLKREVEQMEAQRREGMIIL